MPSDATVSLLSQQFLATPPLEWVAVLSGLAYLLLAIRQSIWCWPCAFLSTSVYIYLYGDVRLYMESALNAFYLIMAVYGYWFWRRGGPRTSTATVRTLNWRWHLLALVSIGVLVLISGTLLRLYTDQANAYVDAATSWSAVWATWLTARKVLENWWYWLVIDIVSVGLFAHRGLVLTALLFVLYIVLIPIGYRQWRQSMRVSA